VIARSDVPPLRKPLADLASDDPNRRRTAYTALVEYLLGDANPVAKRRDMGMLLAQCLAADPAEECVDHLLTQLLRSVPAEHGSTGFELAVVGQSFSAVRCVARGLADSAGDTTRAGRVSAAVQRSIGMTPDPSLPASDLEQACLRGLAEHLFRQLIRAADQPLPQAAALRATIVVEAGPVLSPGQLEKHDAEFLATFLAANSEHWPEFQELVTQRIASTDPLVVLKFIGLFENTTHDELRGFLRSQLVERAGGPPPKEEESVEEVAATVRRALGIANAADPTGQWSKLNREAREVLAATQPPSDSAETLLAETLKLAHFSTLACAFVQNRWEQPEIAAERKNGPKTPQTGLAEAQEATASATPEPPPSVTREQVEALRQTIGLLNSRRSQYPERVMALQSLGRLAETIADLPPDYAAQVASYLLDAKSATEHDKVLEQIPAISRWTQVLVAVADRVVEAPLTQPQLQTLLSRILSRELSLTEGTSGREQGRRALQAYLLERVGAAPVPVEVATVPASPAENTPRLLADAYLLQARTLDLPIPEEAWKSRSPQKVLRHLIQELAHRQQAGELPNALKAELANLSAEITVSEHLAQDELQELVLLERSWIRVLGVEVVRRDQDKLAERMEIVQKLQAFDRNAKSALIQLREGHRTLLQLWLLLGKPLAR